MCWETLNAPPDQYKHTETRKNTSCTIEAMMKHMMLMPFKNFCIQSLCEYVSQLITGLGIVHADGPKVHLFFSQVVGHMKVPGFSGNNHIPCPLNTGRVVLNYWCRLSLRACKVHKKMPQPHYVLLNRHAPTIEKGPAGPNFGRPYLQKFWVFLAGKKCNNWGRSALFSYIFM